MATATLNGEKRAALIAAARGERPTTGPVPCGIRVVNPAVSTAPAAASVAGTTPAMPVVKPAPAVPAVVRDAAASPAPASTVEQLIAAAVASPRQRTRTLAARVRQLLIELREQVETDAATRDAEARVTALRAELAAAEAQLRDARRSVSSTTSASPAPASTDDAEPVDARAVRQWALDNGVECTTQGRVPGRVVQAWRAATGRAV